MTTPIRIEERHDTSFSFTFDATRVLDQGRSEYQDYLVFETEAHGRIFMLDGLTMLTERTHHVYHEMMAFMPASCVESCRDVLIIGGGDGGVATELSKAPDVRSITVAELDPMVADIARRWFPEVAKGLDDPRTTVRFGDGAAFLAEQTSAYDVIIIDSTDICEEALAHAPGDAVASPLATDAFFADLQKALRPGGAVIQMLGSPIFYERSYGELVRRLSRIWPAMRPVLIPTPFYITGDWSLGLYTVDGSLSPRRQPAPAEDLTYFNLEVARGALALPNTIQRLVENG